MMALVTNYETHTMSVKTIIQTTQQVKKLRTKEVQ